MAFVTSEEGKLFFKELLKQSHVVAGKTSFVQADVVEPLQTVPAGETRPPLNPSKKVRQEKST